MGLAPPAMEAIVVAGGGRYRMAHETITTVDGLDKVPWIRPTTVAAVRPLVTATGQGGSDVNRKLALDQDRCVEV